MLRAECPECSGTVKLEENITVGDRVICVECSVELEVLSLHPLELDYPLEDDWDDDWDDDDLDEDKLDADNR